MRTTYGGKSYPEIALLLESEVQSANGETASGVTHPDEEPYPALSNGELIALVQAWKRAAARSKSPTWKGWFDLVLDALGWAQPGDRFIMTREHAKEPADPSVVAMFWESLTELTTQLDRAGTVVKPLIVDWSYAGYEQAARDAWRKMKEDGIATAAPPIDDSAAPAAESGGGGGGWLLLAILAAALATKKQRKG